MCICMCMQLRARVAALRLSARHPDRPDKLAARAREHAHGGRRRPAADGDARPSGPRARARMPVLPRFRPTATRDRESRGRRARPRRAPQAQPLRGPCTHSHGRTLAGRGGGQTRRSAFSARPSAVESPGQHGSAVASASGAWGARLPRHMHPRAHVRWYSLALNETQKYLLTHSQLYIHFLGGLDRFLLSNALPVCSWMT